MSTASGQARTGMLSPGQPCTDFMPASRSTQSVDFRRQGLEQRGLTDPRRPEDRHRGLDIGLGEPLLGGDDLQRHHAASAKAAGGAIRRGGTADVHLGRMAGVAFTAR